MDLNLLNKIGQKFIVGFPETRLTPELIELFETYRFGNVILFRENLIEDEQIKQLNRDLDALILKCTGHRPIICVDQEGGSVSRLPSDSLNIPGQMALAAAGDLETVEYFNELNGRILLSYGFNLNMAPVLDINSEADNPVIGTRSFGDDPRKVTEYARAAMRGLRKSGILFSAKHFPGHGDTKIDSHFGLPEVKESREIIEGRELVPYCMALEEEVPTIVTTHILYPALETKNVPATMSRHILHDLLRGEMGYEGLIISDCMEMKAIQDYFGTPQGIKEAFKAGVDLCFVSHTPRLAIESIKLVYEAYVTGELMMSELDESLERIKRAKEGIVSVSNDLSSEDEQEYRQAILSFMSKTFTCVPRLNGECLTIPDTKFSSKGLFVGPELVGVSADTIQKENLKTFAQSLSQAFGGEGIDYDVKLCQQDIDNIAHRAKDKSFVVLGLYNAHINDGQKALWKVLRQNGRPMLIVALRNPYDLMYLQACEQGICLFEYTKKAIEGLISCLKGTKKPEGVMPVCLPKFSL